MNRRMWSDIRQALARQRLSSHLELLGVIKIWILVPTWRRTHIECQSEDGSQSIENVWENHHRGMNSIGLSSELLHSLQGYSNLLLLESGLLKMIQQLEFAIVS